MRVVASMLWATLLVAAPEPSFLRSAAGTCDVNVAMGQAVKIGASELKVPQCTKDDRDCFFFICSGSIEALVTPMAFARCTLEPPGRTGHPLEFYMKSVAEEVTFIPPFSGRLTCKPWDPESITGLDARALRDAAEEKGHSCQDAPLPQSSDRTFVQCKTNL